MLMTSKGETHPTMSLTDSSHDGPLLILDPETKLYSIVYAGCQIGDPIDIVGEREKIRASAAERMAANPEAYAGLPNSADKEPGT